MHFVLIFFNLALVLAFSAFVVSLLRLRSRPAHLLGIYVLAYADIVLVLQAAGLINALNRQVVLAFQVLLTGITVLLWFRRSRPNLLGPFSGYRPGRLWTDRRSALEWISVGLIAIAVGYVYLRKAQLILSIFPYNFDALTYHLSRVGYWLQYHSLYPWPTPDPRQTTFPMNAELGMLWTVLWWGSDRLSGFVQWITVPAIMLSIYGLTLQLGYSRWRGAFVAMMWATLPQVFFQSSSTQNDLVTASFWAAAVFLLFAGLHDRRLSLAALSGLALGLAIGTKGTSFMVLPGLGVAVLALLPMFFRQPGVRRTLIRWTIACVAGIVLFGSYAYLQNVVAFGRPLGPSTARSGASLVASDEGGSLYTDQLRDNIGRYIFQLADFSPLPFHWGEGINPTKAAIFSRLFQWVRIPVEEKDTVALGEFDLQTPIPADENTAWFGPLTILLFAAASVSAYEVIRHRDLYRFWLLTLGLGFFLTQSALEAWTPYKGRYYLIPISIAFPLLACLVGTRNWWRIALSLAVAAIGLASVLTLTLNSSVLKQITWRDAVAPSRKMPAWPNEFRYLMVKTNVPVEASIGLTGGLNFRDYPFFGENFTHFVTLAIPDDKSLLPHTSLDRFQTDFQRSDYLVLDQSHSPSISESLLQAFDLLGTDGRNSLWVRRGLRPADICDGNRWPFRDFFRVSQDAAVCPQFPVTPPHAASDGTTVYIEGDRYVPLISSKPNGFLKFNLLAKEATQLHLALRVDPQGYTFAQNLELVLSHAGTEPQVYTTEFRGKGLVRFAFALPKGVSTVQLALADSPLEVSIMSIQADTP